jgi:hypothetical protein
LNNHRRKKKVHGTHGGCGCGWLRLRLLRRELSLTI